MFTKEERKAINEAYWKSFRSMMRKHLNAEGKKINWINYHTETKELYVRLAIQENSAIFSLDVQSKDPSIRDLIWEQLIELKKVMENEMPSAATWKDTAYNQANQPIYTIQWQLEGVNQYEAGDTAKIYSFFEKHLLGFDRFYQEYKEVLFSLLH